MRKQACTLQGKVEAVLVGDKPDDHVTRQVEKIQLIRGHGVRGDGHSGPRLVDAREKEMLRFGFSKGAEIANHREFSAVSTEELTEIAKAFGLPDGPLSPGLLGENLVLSGIPRLSQLPSGTLLFFRKSAEQRRTAVLAV